jgi:hypothetical protein
MKIKIFQILLLMMLCAGCNTVTPIDHGVESSILLKQTQTRHCHYFGIIVKFPAETYEAGYKTEDGTYYLCPTKVIWGYEPLSGGIFVPSTNSLDKEQGVWMADFGSTRVFRFTEPLSFEFQKP